MNDIYKVLKKMLIKQEDADKALSLIEGLISPLQQIYLRNSGNEENIKVLVRPTPGYPQTYEEAFVLMDKFMASRDVLQEAFLEEGHEDDFKLLLQSIEILKEKKAEIYAM